MCSEGVWQTCAVNSIEQTTEGLNGLNSVKMKDNRQIPQMSQPFQVAALDLRLTSFLWREDLTSITPRLTQIL